MSDGAGKGRIDCPSGSCAAGEKRDDSKDTRRDKQPKTDIVHARESHVGRADEEGDKPISKASDEGGHGDKEEHEESVRSDDGIPEVSVGGSVGIKHVLDAWVLKFESHPNRESGGDDSHGEGEDEVEGSDIFVVGRVEESSPTGDATRMSGVMVW